MGLLDIYYASQGQLTVNDPDLVTQYPATVTGTPNASQNPGAPPRNFDQPYTSDDTYLTVIAANLTRLQATLPITNFDVEDPGVQGGPNADITTRYPALVTGTPTRTQYPSGPLTNFRQPWLPNQTYIATNPVAGPNSGILSNTLNITSFDVEDPRVQGGPLNDITTQYPVNTSGTPNTTQNTGLTAPFSSGTSAKRFRHIWLPNNDYLSLNPVAGITSGELRNTLPITNFDVEDPGVQGGPISDTTTVYPPLVTGPPNITQNTGLTAPFSSGVAAKRFVQPWLPNLTYLTRNPIATQNSGLLYSTLSVTNLDNFDNRVNDNWSDTITNYPPSWVTGTPNIFQNPGAAPKRFMTKWFPFNGGYAGNNPIAGANSGIQYNIDPNGYNSLKITNLDTTEPGVQGGIPYNQLNDPTIYDLDSNHTEPIRGWFSQPGTPSKKFYQTYNANSTYNEFIQAYI